MWRSMWITRYMDFWKPATHGTGKSGNASKINATRKADRTSVEKKVRKEK